jgi:hypothetical protein
MQQNNKEGLYPRLK